MNQPLQATDLFAPIGVEAFLSDYYLKRAVHLRQKGRSFQSVLTEERIRAAFEVAARDKHPLQIKASFRLPVGNHVVQISPDQAMPCFDLGATICTMGLESLVPELQALAIRVKSQLAYAGAIIPSVYYSPDGQGFNTHFDARTALTLQLHGSKTWHYAKTSNVAFPLANGVRNRKTASYEYRGTSHAQLRVPPLKAPRTQDLETVTLRPGDVLILPPGAWHSANAKGVSLALNLSLNYPLDGLPFMHMLEAALLQQPLDPAAWRAPPPPVHDWASVATPPVVSDYVRARISDLRMLLDALDPDGPEINRAWHAMVSSTEGLDPPRKQPPQPPRPPITRDTRFTGPYKGQLRLGDANGGEAFTVISLHPAFELPFPRGALELMRRLMAVRQPFRAGDATSWGKKRTPLKWADLQGLLTQLEALGVIHRLT